MFSKKTKLKLTNFECNLLWGGMNEFRNNLLSDGISTEDIDELLFNPCFCFYRRCIYHHTGNPITI